MRFEAVVFDLFGTLVPGFSEERFNASLAAMAGALGVSGEEFVRQWSFETWEERATGRFETIEANVRGQEHVKRAMVVAAAGGHNVLMMCPVMTIPLLMDKPRGRRGRRPSNTLQAA